MAKTSMIEKNLRRRRYIASDAPKRQELKDIVSNKTLPLPERFAATLKLAKMRRNGSPTRARNICELTGRARGYYRKFRLSRICVRQLANQGLLPGVVKASW
ncbi:MAG: 30S ribosomal protein S14 [Proteobacteria bacterium]|nr:30S ribosomal protein S14 [Pseudomonadota bacterium]